MAETNDSKTEQRSEETREQRDQLERQQSEGVKHPDCVVDLHYIRVKKNPLRYRYFFRVFDRLADKSDDKEQYEGPFEFEPNTSLNRRWSEFQLGLEALGAIQTVCKAKFGDNAHVLVYCDIPLLPKVLINIGKHTPPKALAKQLAFVWKESEKMEISFHSDGLGAKLAKNGRELLGRYPPMPKAFIRKG